LLVTVSTKDPMARFAVVGEHLDKGLRKEILALGSTTVPALLRYLEDEELWLDESPGSGWPPIHAVDLLADLKAPAAVLPMVRALCETTWDDIIHDRLVGRLPEFGAAVLEPALAALRPATTEDVHRAVCCVLAKSGVRDPRIYAELCKLFDEHEVMGSACLADYGDPAALPIIEGAIEDFEPAFDSPVGAMGLTDLLDAHERLGGSLPPALRRRAEGQFEAFKNHRLALTQPSPQIADKVGRNDPCPCGSGLKFKKCCLSKIPAGTRTVHHRGQSFVASKGITDADLDAASTFFERNPRGRGPTQQISDFSQPLIDAAKDVASLQNALSMGMLFWNLAICEDDLLREEMLKEIVKEKFEGEASEFLAVAAQMIDRHRKMFPEMHKA